MKSVIFVKRRGWGIMYSGKYVKFSQRGLKYRSGQASEFSECGQTFFSLEKEPTQYDVRQGTAKDMIEKEKSTANKTYVLVSVVFKSYNKM